MIAATKKNLPSQEDICQFIRVIKFIRFIELPIRSLYKLYELYKHYKLYELYGLTPVYQLTGFSERLGKVIYWYQSSIVL